MEEKISSEVTQATQSEKIVKNVTNVLKKVSIDAIGNDESIGTIGNSSKFKVCTSTALTKPTVWSKIKRVLLTEITVELTPYQQKVENEVNEFLHKEITWQSIKAFWTQEIKIKL
jgi:hypothetical protein